MPKKFKRNCDFCEKPYVGYGAKYCSKKCSQKAATMQELAGTPDVGDHIDAKKADVVAKWEAKTSKQLWKERAWTSLIMDACLDAIKVTPEPTLEKYRGKTRTSKKVAPKHTETANLMISDVEIGQFVDPVETGGYGNYNFKVFQERARNMKYGVEQILNLHQSLYPVPTLNVFFLGDIVHGMNSSGAWGPAYLEFDVVQQMFKGVTAFAEMLMYWSQIVDEINVVGVYGNHGRGASMGKEKYYVNWDYIMLEFLREKLKNYKNIKWTVDTSWFKMHDIMGHTALCVHGDDTKGWMGTPFYGLVRDTKSYKSVFEKDIKFVLLGHHHVMAEVPVDNTFVKVNGNWVGGSTYSLKSCKATSKPQQRMFGVSSHGETWEYKIDLDRERNV